MFRLIKKLICKFKGHDFGPVVYVLPSVLVHCYRCGTELQDRTIDDLEPMTEEDIDFIESMGELND